MSSRRSRSGGQVQGEDVQPVEEILAKSAATNLGGEIPRGRRHHAHVDLDVLAVAEAAHLALLQDAQELDLQAERQLANLVEEQRAARGLFEQPLAIAIGVGERALCDARRARTRAGCREWRRN